MVDVQIIEILVSSDLHGSHGLDDVGRHDFSEHRCQCRVSTGFSRTLAEILWDRILRGRTGDLLTGTPCPQNGGFAGRSGLATTESAHGHSVVELKIFTADSARIASVQFRI